jgi:hypothetical protein
MPRVVTLDGDHTITLPLLGLISRAYGPVSVIHFGSHLDTRKSCYICKMLYYQLKTMSVGEAKGLCWVSFRNRKRQSRYIHISTTLPSKAY